MAERKVKQWITVNGVHVPIFEGESKEEAVKKHLDQTKTKKGPKLGDKRATKSSRPRTFRDDGLVVPGSKGKSITEQEEKLKNVPPEMRKKLERQLAAARANEKFIDSQASKLKEHGYFYMFNDEIQGDKLEFQKLLKSKGLEVKDNDQQGNFKIGKSGADKQTKTQKPDLSTQGTYNLKGEKAPKDLPRVSDEDAKHNKTVEYDGQRYQTQQVVDYKKEEGGEYVAGHMYVPIDPKGKGSFFVSKDGEMYHSGSDYLQAKAKARWAEQANKEANEKEKQIAENKKQADAVSGKLKSIDDLKKEYDSIKGNSPADATRRAELSKEMGNKIVSGLVSGQTYKVPSKNGYEELKYVGSNKLSGGTVVAKFETPNGVRKGISYTGDMLYGIAPNSSEKKDAMQHATETILSKEAAQGLGRLKEKYSGGLKDISSFNSDKELTAYFNGTVKQLYASARISYAEYMRQYNEILKRSAQLAKKKKG